MKTKRTVKNKKQKGTYAERELVKMFWGAGFAAMRAAGSGNTTLPSPDVIASNGRLSFAVECKSYSSDYIHLRWDQIVQLIEFAQKFGAVPIVGARFENRDWLFFDINMIRGTKGENFRISKKDAYKDGKRFEELIEIYEQARLI